MYIGNGAFYDPDFAMKSVTNSGLILSAGSGDLAIIGTTVMNTGTLAATGSGGITLRCASVDMEAGSQLSIGKGSSLTLDAGLLLAGLYSPGSSTLTVSGTVMNAGTIALYGRADNYNTPGAFLDIGAQGATLSGGGTVVMDPQSKHGSYDFIESAVAGAVLTNASNTISGAGQLGDGVLSLVNASQGVIDANNPNYALVLNTASAIANAGLIEASGGGEAQIIAAIANTGTLAANGGTLIAEGAVSGAGAAIIDGGTLDFGSAFSENVTFTGATGVLELAESQAYTGEVTGFSLTGATALDLGDIDFTKGATKASYSGTTTSGVLTVTDGTHTAHITLEGNYVSSTFTVSSDGHGGTKVVDPSRSPATGQLPASADVLIAAIATVGARAASLPHEAATNDIAGRTLLAPGRSVSLG